MLTVRSCLGISNDLVHGLCVLEAIAGRKVKRAILRVDVVVLSRSSHAYRRGIRGRERGVDVHADGGR